MPEDKAGTDTGKKSPAKAGPVTARARARQRAAAAAEAERARANRIEELLTELFVALESADEQTAAAEAKRDQRIAEADEQRRKAVARANATYASAVAKLSAPQHTAILALKEDLGLTEPDIVAKTGLELGEVRKLLRVAKQSDNSPVAASAVTESDAVTAVQDDSAEASADSPALPAGEPAAASEHPTEADTSPTSAVDGDPAPAAVTAPVAADPVGASSVS
ncbi:hypothetical protein [Nocardia salmonicida]|uniref:hypothetical protein n=1 Tax=Nocardia salmonicida TaxID=53431 RepID=UPI0007A4EF24|nr:hypothetical protein [Nocardia salmonicida]